MRSLDVSQGTIIGIDQLIIGSTAACDLLDLDGQVAIPTGSPITPNLLAEIKSAGVVALLPKRSDFSTHHMSTGKPGLTAIASRIGEMQRRSGIINPLTSPTCDLARKTVSDTVAAVSSGKLPDIDGLNLVIDRILHDTELLQTPPLPCPSGDSDCAVDRIIDSALDMAVLMSWHLRRDGVAESCVRASTLGALLHDIGLAQIKPSILDSPETLSQCDVREIRRHPYLGLRSITALGDKIPQDARDIILMHHENDDGSGYPLHRSGGKIPRVAQLARILDSYIALVSHRPHRASVSPHQAIEILMRGSGKTYNGDILGQFIKRTGRYPLGSAVILSNNEIGVVVGMGSGSPFKPVVDVYFSNRQKFQETPQRVDLGRDHLKYIRQVMR